MIGAQAGGRTANAWSARPLPGGVGPVTESQHLKQMLKANTGYRNSKEGSWKGWLDLRRDNWQSAPHLVEKLNVKHLFLYIK